jgi:hypothetical protein
MLRRFRLAAAILLVVGIAGPATAQVLTPDTAPSRWLPPSRLAVLQTLDKITGRVRTVEAPIEQTIRFGTFLEIREIKAGETPRTLFVGWMFASSPAVSALEHPVYDVWVIECRSATPSGSSSR